MGGSSLYDLSASSAEWTESVLVFILEHKGHCVACFVHVPSNYCYHCNNARYCVNRKGSVFGRVVVVLLSSSSLYTVRCSYDDARLERFPRGCSPRVLPRLLSPHHGPSRFSSGFFFFFFSAATRQQRHAPTAFVAASAAHSSARNSFSAL